MAQLVNENHHFSTSDSAEAAYLVLQGYTEFTTEYISTKRECTFCFADDDGDIQLSIRTFRSGKAEGNINLFYHHYKRILAKVHEARNG